MNELIEQAPANGAAKTLTSSNFRIISTKDTLSSIFKCLADWHKNLVQESTTRDDGMSIPSKLTIMRLTNRLNCNVKMNSAHKATNQCRGVSTEKTPVKNSFSTKIK